MGGGRLKRKPNATGSSFYSWLPKWIVGKNEEPGPKAKLPRGNLKVLNGSIIDKAVTFVISAVICLLIIFALLGIYYAYRQIRNYLKSLRFKASITLMYPQPPVVGQTLTCRIRFKGTGSGKYLSRGSSFIQELRGNPYAINILVHNDRLSKPIAVVQEVTDNHVTGKFSLRIAGTYEITVKYQSSFNFEMDGPFFMVVNAAEPSHKFMDFGSHNPQMLCLTERCEQFIKISCKDKYGNHCQLEDIQLNKFGFNVFHLGNAIPVDHEFILHEASPPFNAQPKDDQDHKSICLRLILHEPGIYPCTLSYDNHLVQGPLKTQKIIVCVSRDEEERLKCNLFGTYLPGTLMYSGICKMAIVGGDDELKDFENAFIGVSGKGHTLMFGYWTFQLYTFPRVTFPINGKTKLNYYESGLVNNDTDTVNFYVEDGLQDSVGVEMEAEEARILLLTFGHNQGFGLPRLEFTFQEKKEFLRNQLRSSIPLITYFRSCLEKVIHIQPGNIINTTLDQVPTNKADWLIRFAVTCEPCGPPKLQKGHTEFQGHQFRTTSYLKEHADTTQEWMDYLLHTFFVESEMFHKLGGSALLHPNNCKLSGMHLNVYRLAGQILAKALVDVLLHGKCTKLSNVKLTRSFLAFLLGLPAHYKFLEADEPNYFRQVIRPLLESDVSQERLTFTAIPLSRSSSESNNNINLLPNGSNISVTNENMEYFLNLLATHRLIHTVELEMTAFRDGFHFVIDSEKLCDFYEDDLQMLISGGYKFDVDNIKHNHRVVKEVDPLDRIIREQTRGRNMVNSEKLLNWFWHVVENLSEKEQSYLTFFTTGNFSLPACGMEDLNPPFTISLTGSLNHAPRGHSQSNEIVIGDHVCFDSFEQSLLQTIIPASERIALPTGTAGTQLMICPRNELGNVCLEEVEEEVEDDETTESPEADATQNPDAFFTWVRRRVNL